MSTVNRVILLGRLGRDVELRTTSSGASVANVSLATSRRWTDKAGERAEETQWHSVTFFDRLADIASLYLAKGSLVYVEGRLKTRTFTDKEGVERSATDIVAEQMQLVGGRPEADGAPNSDVQQQRSAPAQQRSAPAQQRSTPSRSTGPASAPQRAAAAAAPVQGGRSAARRPVPAGDFDDDDVPFARSAVLPLAEEVSNARHADQSGASRRSRHAR